MIRIQKILFPTDFSDTSSAALGHALMLADCFHASLTMLHAARTKEAEKALRFPELDPTTDEFETLLEEQLAEIIGAQPSHKLRVDRVVHQNDDPIKAICTFADANHIDLIIMGTHGRTGLSHWLSGSVAEEVVRHASCPVMTVRACKKSAEVAPYLNILVPIDFSPYSQKALRYGRTLALLFEATLHVLHVVDQPVHPAHYGLGDDLLLHLNPDVQRRSREEMELLVSQLGPETVPCQTHVREGRAYGEIVKFTETHECDLVVMGTHGLSGLEHFLLGGTTEKVMRHVSCPVLAVKLKERDFVE
ncbi:MAG: universal stress protein [candidate division KSB1 bacterium]|nr:universal stress protein [candidate division KSB1 bacterium]MDZ7300634.1 universal stress protein [candidate division KSB1 bacterium]MDZ7309771.1 universal stress protein [candidate division KSB1 bacterium]